MVWRCVSDTVLVRTGYLWWFFFFQAEDGIRDLVRSRGLGDVYKRQVIRWKKRNYSVARLLATGQVGTNFLRIQTKCMRPVSYTHLTLPTSDLV